MGQGKTKVSAGFCIMLSLMLLIVPFRWLTAMIFAAMFHEFCHLFAIRLLVGKQAAIRLYSYSARIDLPEMSRGKELLCALAGPVSGFLLFGLCRWFPRLALCGLIQSIYNLLPIYPLDGGRILSCLLYTLLPPPHANKILFAVSIICKVLILTIGIYGSFFLELGPLCLLGALLVTVRIK